MSFNKFKLLEETSDKFHLLHPSGKKFEVHKAKLTSQAIKKIQTLADGGGVKKLADLPAAQEDILGLMHGTYPDTGRVASSPGERFDSLTGAPVRAGIKAAQEGRFGDVLPEMYKQFNVDPQSAPTGEQLVETAGVTNPYAAKALGFGLELASDPSTYIGGKLPMPGVAGEIINASKRFPKKATAAQTKKIKKAAEIETPAIQETTAPIGELKEVPSEISKIHPDLRDVYLETKKRVNHDPELLENLEEAQGHDVPYVDSKSNFGKIPNFKFQAGDILGDPMKIDAEPLPWSDTKFLITKTALKNKKEPVTIHTRSDLIARDDYLDALPKGSVVNIHGLSSNDRLNRILFPANPSQERLKLAAEKLKKAGVKVNFILPSPEQIIELAKNQKNVKDDPNFILRITGLTESQFKKKLKKEAKEQLKIDESKLKLVKPIKEAHGGIIPGYSDGGGVLNIQPDASDIMPMNATPLASQIGEQAVQSLQQPIDQIITEDQRQQSLENEIAGRTEMQKAIEKSKVYRPIGILPEEIPDVEDAGQNAQIRTDVMANMLAEQKNQQALRIGQMRQERDLILAENAQRQQLGLPPKPVPSIATDQDLAQAAQMRMMPQSTPPAINPFSEKMRAMDQAFALQQQGLKEALSEADKALISQNAARETYINQLRKLETPEQIAARYRAKDDDYKKYFETNQINPNKYWNDMGTGGKIATAIALALGGAAGGASGRNVVLDMINNATEREIRAQQFAHGEKMSLWKMNRDLMHSDIEANLATRNQLVSMFQAQISAAAARTTNAQAKLQLLQMSTDLEAQKAQNRLQLALFGGQGEQGGAANMNPSRLVGMMITNPADRSTAFKEVQAAENTVRMKKAIMQAFEAAAKENTALKTGFGLARVPGSVQALHQHMMPTFTDLEGSATEGKIHQTLNNITPKPGDFEHTIAQKRRMLREYLQSKMSAPVTSSYGINLQNFVSTSQNPFTSMTPQEKSMYIWATAHPTDARSQAFFMKMGIEE